MTSGEGVLNFRGEEQPFDLSQTVAVPSFGLRQTLTYRDLIRILLGRVPAVFEEPLEKPADSIFKQNGAITSLWKTDSMEFHVRMEHHPAEVVELVSINKGNDGEELTMSAFKYGRASRIAVQESDGNYFSVTYSRVKPH